MSDHRVPHDPAPASAPSWLIRVGGIAVALVVAALIKVAF